MLTVKCAAAPETDTLTVSRSDTNKEELILCVNDNENEDKPQEAYIRLSPATALALSTQLRKWATEAAAKVGVRWSGRI